jgi:hypothetical protein
MTHSSALHSDAPLLSRTLQLSGNVRVSLRRAAQRELG